MPSGLFYPLPFNLWAFIIVKNHRKTHFEKSALITPADKKDEQVTEEKHVETSICIIDLHYLRKLTSKGPRAFFPDSSM